jgi:NADH-quinone oxidoreductase subunit N
VYAFMTIGSFAVVAVVAHREDAHSIDDYRRLATRRPLLAAVFAFLLLAQAGIPPTGGFIAKLGVFGAAADAHSYALLLIGVLTSVVSAYYYLRVILAMYASEGTAPEAAEAAPAGEPVPARVDAATGLVLALSVVAVLAVGVLPSLLLDFAHDATLLF